MIKNYKFLTKVAMLLLTFLIPLAGWGQTYEMTTSLVAGDEVVLVNTSVTKELGSLTTSGTTYGTAVDVANSTPVGSNLLTVVAGNTEGSFAFKTSNGKYLSWSSGNSLTSADEVTNASSWTITFDDEGNATVTNVGTTARILSYNSGSPRFACYGNMNQQRVRFYKKESAASDAPSITASNVDIDYDVTGGEISYTINNGVDGGVLNASVTDGDWLILSGTNFESPIAFTCETNDGAERTATVTLTYSYGDNETVTKDVTVTQAAYVPTVPGYEIDFENEATQYTDWTFTNMESKQTGSDKVNAHGGTYYGTTGGKASASITTKTKIATPYTLTCYVTKQSNNTTASNWKIEVSSDGEVWTTVKEQSATSMTAGTWVELTASLTSYTDVYVRVSYSGSTAVRNIDDLTLVTEIPTSPLINAENPAELTYDATSGEIAYTITNPVEGTLLQATADVDWVSDIIVGDEAITFTTTANELKTERVATFTLTYEGAEDKTVTVTQAGNPNIIDKIENISEVGAYYAVKGTVVAKNSRGFVIGDGTGYVYTYLGTAPSYSVGDMVKISGTTGTYGNVIQFTSAATFEAATDSEYTPLTPASMTEVPDFTDGYHLSEYYQFEGTLTKSGSNYIVAVGEGQLRFSYPTQTEELEALDGKTVTAKAYFSGISGSGDNAIATFMLESIEEVVTTVTITIKNGFSATTFSCDKALNFEGVEGVTVSYINYVEDNGNANMIRLRKAPAYTGLFIEAQPGIYEIPVIESAGEPANNALVPTEQATGQVLTFASSESETYYAYGKQDGKEAFFKIPTTGYTLPQGNKAVLKINTPASGAKEMIELNGGTTAIDNSQLTIDSLDGEWFDLSGRKLSNGQIQKGIYIVGGRKVVVK